MNHFNNTEKPSVIKKIFISIGAMIILTLLLIIAKLMGYFTHPSFEYMEEFNFNEANITQTFDVDLSREGTYLVGLYTEQFYQFLKEKNDGNYTIEYYDKNQLLRTFPPKKVYRTIKSIPAEVWDSSGIAIPLDEVVIPKDLPRKKITIRITTYKPYSIFLRKGLDKDLKVHFFLKKRTHKELRIREEVYKMDAEEARSGLKVDFEDINKSYDSNSSKITLIKALLAKNFKIVQSSIDTDNGLEINTLIGENKENESTNKRTPIFYAAYANDVKTLRYLIAKGADLNHTDAYRQNALAIAIENSSIDAAKVLIDAGMKISDVDFVHRYLAKEEHERGHVQSPLVYAYSIGSYDLAKFLIEHNATNKFPKTVRTGGLDAYHYLYDIPNYRPMLKLLLDHKIPDFKGVLPNKQELKELYDGCLLGIYTDCGPINKELKFEELDYYIYFDERHYANKMQAIRDEMLKQEQHNKPKGEK